MALSIPSLRIEQYCCLFLSYWLRMADHDVTNLGTQGPINHLTCGSTAPDALVPGLGFTYML